MIYCPNCGTANRDGSSFCNQCGHRFGMGSKTACPACGSENPLENLFCDACGARLAPLVTKGVEEKPGVKGLSLPTKPVDEETLLERESLEPETPSEDALREDAEEEDIPDWLARLRASIGTESDSQGGQEMSSLAAAAPLFDSSGDDADEEIPEWLQALNAPEPAAPDEDDAVEPTLLEKEPSPAEETAEPEEEAAQSEEEPLAGESPDAEEHPLAEESPEEEAIVEMAPEEEPGDYALPELTSEETLAEEEAPTEVAESLEEAEEPDAPALSETAEPGMQEAKEDLTAWLQQEGPVILEAEEGEEDEAIVFQPESLPQEATPSSSIPAWLETLAPEGVVFPEELGPAFTPAGLPSPEDVGLERAEIPSWLEDLRPGRQKEEARVEEPVVAGGILAGLRGALQMVGAVDPTPSQRTRPVSAPVSTTAAHAEMLTRLLNEPTSALARTRFVPTASRPARGLPWLASLLLLAAVLIPFFVPGLVPGGNTVPASKPAADLSSQIQRLNQGDVVLISLDYDPGASTELDWPVRVVLEDLRARGAILLITSVTPTGPGLAARFDMAGTQSVLLGYLPGQEMGLRRLAAGLSGVFPMDFQGNSVSEAPFGVRSLDDVALILTAASSQETVRWWVEQVKTQFPSIPMGAVVSGAIEPAVRPYYASSQLAGLVSGWVGGQAYRQAAAPTEAASKQDIAAMEAQSLAHLTIVLLIVLGNIAYWSKRLFGRQP